MLLESKNSLIISRTNSIPFNSNMNRRVQGTEIREQRTVVSWYQRILKNTNRAKYYTE